MTRLPALLALALALTACRKEEPVDLDGDSKSPPEDCNDLDNTVHPGAEELCDGVDNNCNGTVDEEAVDAPNFYADADGDGFGDAASAVSACAASEGYVADDRDCDDAAANIHPGAAEADCTDSTDYNCDGSVGYADADGDGHAACEDCDDAAAARFPGNLEICDDLDNDCDSTVDEEATDATTFFADYDGDGFGNADVTAAACEVPEGFAAASGDCDDLAATAFPGGSEVCDGLDNDCNGTADIGASDATAWYPDQDGDRFGDGASAVTACEAPEGHLAAAGDCDDADASAHPGGTEVCDGADDDCDGHADEDAADRTLSYADADADGYGDPTSGLLACETAQGRVAVAQDCDDTAADRFPGNSEVCDSVDNDCDGVPDDNAVDARLWYADADADSYGAGAGVRACEAPAASAERSGDCDDRLATRFPGNSEVCDSVDNDCDGNVDDDATNATTWYLDHDGDGSGLARVFERACEAPAGYVASSDDCDDANALRFPGNPEVFCDGHDNDCSGDVATEADQDRDGFRACENDCDDLNRYIHPDATELCDDVDNNCDDDVDEGLVGVLESCPAESCLDLHTRYPALSDGRYWIDPADEGVGYEVPCEMTDGGWTGVEYASDLPFMNRWTTGDAWRWLPSDLSFRLPLAQIAALQDLSSEGHQTFVMRCEHMISYWYEEGNNYDHAVAFRFLDTTTTAHALASYAPYDISVPIDGCRVNGGTSSSIEDGPAHFEIRSVLLPVVNVQTRDSGDPSEKFGSNLTQYPAWLR